MLLNESILEPVIRKHFLSMVSGPWLLRNSLDVGSQGLRTTTPPEGQEVVYRQRPHLSWRNAELLAHYPTVFLSPWVK